LTQLKPTSLNLYFEFVPMQIMSTIIIHLQKVLRIHLVNSLHYTIRLDQIASLKVESQTSHQSILSGEHKHSKQTDNKRQQIIHRNS